VIWYEKALPTAPLTAVELVITGAAELTVSVRLALPVPPELVALTVTVEVPAVAGVPEINPVVGLTASPDGKPVAV
jgi:hypothetical protein